MSKKNSSQKIKVALFSSLITGGAGVAAFRLYQSFKLYPQVEATLFVRELPEEYNDSSIKIFKRTPDEIAQIEYFKDHAYHNTYPGNSKFSYPNVGRNFTQLDEIIKEFDIINLHWISDFLSLEEVAYLTHHNTPIFWTIHDKNLLGGGCHCFHECELWKQSCGNCPQINTSQEMTEQVFNAKKKYFNLKNIHLIVLNRHFQKIVSESPLFKDVPTNIIFNSVDLHIFKPDPSLKVKLREKYNIPQEKIVLFYSTDYFSTIKGYREWIEALWQINNNSKFHALITGPMTTKNLDIPIPFTATGKVSHDTMADLYRVSDITVIPSIEDNLPNAILESLGCGVPVIGFDVGGIPDLIISENTGLIVPRKNTEVFAECIETLATELYDNQPYSKRCRAFAEEHLSPELQAEKYYQVYKNALHVDNTSPTHATQEEFPKIKEIRYKILSYGLASYIQNIKENYEKDINHLKSNDYYAFGQLPTKKKITGIFSLIKKIISRKS